MPRCCAPPRRRAARQQASTRHRPIWCHAASAALALRRAALRGCTCRRLSHQRIVPTSPVYATVERAVAHAEHSERCSTPMQNRARQCLAPSRAVQTSHGDQKRVIRSRQPPTAHHRGPVQPHQKALGSSCRSHPEDSPHASRRGGRALTPPPAAECATVAAGWRKADREGSSVHEDAGAHRSLHRHSLPRRQRADPSSSWRASPSLATRPSGNERVGRASKRARIPRVHRDPPKAMSE
mmetsp:Transcript_33442/g.108206  ORF Transcript_33442/g.108206 Transcript_33442/m.108206 type:complete len:239 (+) Transcript_33442:3439-4155(+)|eukprot:scaffold12828_cov112-Isochrysis_galbana.AAC.7